MVWPTIHFMSFTDYFDCSLQSDINISRKIFNRCCLNHSLILNETPSLKARKHLRFEKDLNEDEDDTGIIFSQYCREEQEIGT